MATTDLHKALSEISAIRGHIARGAVFRGYGPITLAATGLLAFAAALVQAYWLPAPQRDVVAYLAIWVPTAALSLLIISVETITRARRLHCGLAAQMMQCRRRAVSACHRRRIVADGGAAALAPAGPVDVAGPVAGDIQPGCIRLLPLPAARHVRRGYLVSVLRPDVPFDRGRARMRSGPG